MDLHSTHSLGNCVFSNCLIVSTIFPYLPFRDQIVFSRLNTTTKKLFPFLFTSKTKCQFDSYNDINQYVQLNRKLRRHSRFIFHSSINLAAGLKMKPDPIDTYISRVNGSCITESAPKMYSLEESNIMQQFLASCAIYVTSLKGAIAWRGWDEFTNLVKHFPNVLDLDLSVDRGTNSTRTIPTITGWECKEYRQNKVQRLKVRFKLSKKDEESETALNMFVDLVLATFPNVQHLQLFPWKEELIKPMASYCRQKMLDLRNLPHLKEITCVDSESSIFYLEPAPLERPLLNDPFWTIKEYEAMNFVLEGYGSNLITGVHIDLRIDCMKLEKDVEDNFIVPLSFPRLPNLKQLSLRITADLKKSFSLSFPLMDVNYEQMFPKLSELWTITDSRKEISPCMESINKKFVPFMDRATANPPGICSTLSCLTLFQHFTTDETEKKLHFIQQAMKTFPNVLRFRLNDNTAFFPPSYTMPLTSLL